MRTKTRLKLPDYARKAELSAITGAGMIGTSTGQTVEQQLASKQAAATAVTAVNTVAPVAGNVSLTTSNIPEGTGLYLTATRVLNTTLAGLSLATNAVIAAGDSVLTGLGKLQKQLSDWIAAKDAANGYAGLTGFSHNVWNNAGTFKSQLQSLATAARTLTLPDQSGTLAVLTDIPAATAAGSITLLSTDTIGAAVGNIDRLNVFTAAYDRYFIAVEGMTQSSATAASIVLIFAKAGVADVATVYTAMGSGDNLGLTVNATSLTMTPGFTSANYANFAVDVQNANDAVANKSVDVRGGAGLALISRGGMYASANAVTGFRLTWNAAVNFTRGTVRVYGIKNT